MNSNLGVRSFNENFLNETDQDANSVLTELDKGLRSTKIGEQCEAIVRYPKLFEKYPFPILINSSFLKLADFFRYGSNLLRLWILRVCQQSEKHLEKIFNVDEFVKRIFTVMHSNDPIARALALRTLGAVAGVIPEKQQVHHAIRRSLDSHDAVEVEAAIQASGQFAAQSKVFAISMCSKVASMIESLKIPIGMKLQLIPVLRHMHHDANTAALVKTLCIELLPKYPSENFVVVILESLTQLSVATLVDIPDQVTLLLTYLQDPRKRIRYSILRSMLSLAKKGAHLWPRGTLQSLISKAMVCNDIGNEQSLILSVVRSLTDCPVTCNALLNDEQHLLLELCSMCLVLEHHTAASQAIGILTSVVSYCHTEKIPPPQAYMTQIDLHLESLIYTSLTNEKHRKELKHYLVCGVRLSEKNLDFGARFVTQIAGILTDDFTYPMETFVLITETLGALCSQFANHKYSTSSHSATPSASSASSSSMDYESGQDAFQLILPSLLCRLDTFAERFDADYVRCIEILAAVCLQALLGCQMDARTLAVFDKVLQVTNPWTQYRIGRSASRYGHHFLAARIFHQLSSKVSIEKLHFFLCALCHVSKAECVLIYGFDYDQIASDFSVLTSCASSPFSLAERIEKATTLYWKALATLKASSSPSHPLTFQSEFVRLRGQFLEALFNVVIIKNTHNITPPPAIAHTLAQNSRDYLQKFGHVTNQLRKTVKTIKLCEDAYGKLYKSVFDADTCTLEYLEITKSTCVILGNSVETICFASPSDLPSFPTESTFPETKYLINTCMKMKRELATLPATEPGVQKSITTKHTDTIIRQIETLLRSPICVPRFFFQVLQTTSIKLSVSPQPRVPGDPVVVQPGSSLVVKIEGVIQHHSSNAKASLFRTIDSVQLTLTSQLISPKANDFKANTGDSITLTQTVKPHRDFLSGSFLVPLNNMQPTGQFGANVCMGGHWQVTLEAFVIDGNSVLWNTGPKSTLFVRVAEDQTKTAGATSGIRRF